MADRKSVLANANAWRICRRTLEKLDQWTVLAAIAMPDHMHLLIAPVSDRDASVSEFAKWFKRWFNEAYWDGRTSLSENERNWKWQEGCFDRLLRSDESLSEKWEYLRQNPVRAGLAKEPDDWPFQFQFNQLGFDSRSIALLEAAQPKLYHSAMAAAFRLTTMLALCVSLMTIVLPMRSPAAISPKGECCAHMQMDGDQNDCSRHVPKSNQDRQCCSACAVCLSLFLNAKTPFLFPRSAGELLAITSARNIVRTDQPPVPPPRAMFV